MNTHPEQWAAMLQRPGSSWGSVPCSRTPQSWYWRRILPPPTIPAGPEIRTHNLPLTSPTRYPLGHDCPRDMMSHDYFTDVLATSLGLWTFWLHCGLWRVRKLSDFIKNIYKNLCSEDERWSEGFKMAWGN